MPLPSISDADQFRALGDIQSAKVQPVELPSSPFSLTDAAEEKSFGREEEIEDKSLDERKVEEYKPPEVPELEQIDAYLTAMYQGEEGAAKLMERVKKLLDMAAKGENVFGALDGSRGEASRDYLTLAKALHTARNEGRPAAELTSVADAIDRLMARDGAAIRADLNTIRQSQAYGKDHASGELFRSTYRDAIMGCTQLHDTLMLLLRNFGNDLENGIALMREALGADMASIHPSTQPERLNLLLQDLYQLGVMCGVLDNCQQLAERMKYLQMKRFEAPALLEDLVRWAREPLVFSFHATELLNKYCRDEQDQVLNDKREEDKLRWHDQPQRHGGKGGQGDDDEDDEDDEGEDLPDGDPREVFLVGSIGVLRSMPSKIFPSDEHRFEAMSVIQQLVDQIVGIST
ncbi:HrpJ domain-containing protein [Noviherbaspirillum galbum]|uniref:Hypersensitivity response secretion-like HrpJ domain-containing protein n=1 Tax=Noviherbaspirillum galbum TaxID=2709383 RepID=A0A6B3STU7_9BURK|nr:HrpJ domain-containing protein [Noviherbaspirillum galbum]NEX64223.1 hypothetical protein [Noviherbaspirillum galbum]